LDSCYSLYIDVDSIDVVEKSLPKENILIPKRKTFYGSIEIWAKDSSGKIIGFAQKVDMYDLLKKFLIRDGTVAEVGCGNGRDANWLIDNGCPRGGRFLHKP